MSAKAIQKLLILAGVTCLGLWGFFTVQARIEQSVLEEELYLPRPFHTDASISKYHLEEGDLFGRLEVPRLNMSVMVMEGIDARTLRLGAGHIPGTPMALAAHRDSFFRPLKDVQVDDTIRLTTPDGVAEYRVVSTKVVPPTDTSVLDAPSDKTLVLVTCYPFYFIGPAPQRFIVEAIKN
jgi:sortase A